MARLLPYCLQWSTTCCMTSYKVWQRAAPHISSSFFGNWMTYAFCSILSIIFFSSPNFPRWTKNIQLEKWPKHVNCETGFSESDFSGSHGSFHSANFSLIGNRWAQPLVKKFSILLGAFGNVWWHFFFFLKNWKPATN